MAEQTLDSSGFSDPNRAIRMRDAIRAIAEQEVGKLTASQQIGRVMSANFASMTAQVWIPGDPSPITVSIFDQIIPGSIGDQGYFPDTLPTSTTGAGSLVVIDRINGKLWLTQVLSGGQFSKNLGAAGFVHKSLNGLHVDASDAPSLWSNSPPVSGNYGLEVSFFAPSNGLSCMVGPFVATGDAQFWPGHFKVYVSRYEQTYKFEANLEDNQIWPGGSFGTPPRWYRLMPERMGGRYADMNMNVDIGVRHTGYRDKQGVNEVWLRFYDAFHGSDFFFAHVEAYGPMITFGDVNLGRIRLEDAGDATADEYQYEGYLGVHDSYFPLRGRTRDAGQTDPPILTGGFDDDLITTASWYSGSFTAGPRRMWADLKHLWFPTGTVTWNGTGVKWTGALNFTGIAAHPNALPAGGLAMPMPGTGAKIPVVPNSTNSNPPTYQNVATVDATNGIPLAANQTLYLMVPPGIMTKSADPYMTDWHTFSHLFVIVNNNVPMDTFIFQLPEFLIPIAHRGASTDLDEFHFYGADTQLYDSTQYSSVSSTASTAALALNTETILLSTPTMKFKNNGAYRVKFKTGYSMTTATTVVSFRLRKGTATTTDWGEFFRQPGANSAALASVQGYSGELILVNTSGSDINSQVSVTGQLLGTGTGTWTAYANTTTKRFLEIEYCGPASKFSTVGVAIS